MHFRTIALSILIATNAWAQSPASLATARYMESARNNPGLLVAFLREMPKGGDLHNHLSGAIYAESFIEWGAAMGACVRTTDYVAVRPPCDATAVPIANALRDDVLRGRIIDQWSMRNWSRAVESGHDHFFATFGKFGLTDEGRAGDEVAEEVSRAAHDRLSYVELMWTPAGRTADSASAEIRQMLDRKNQLLKCGTPNADPGCKVEVRFLYQVLRGLDINVVRSMIHLGFEVSSKGTNFVGFNLVMPEDCLVCMRDYSSHMATIDSLHARYPQVKITLHAGELVPGLVPTEGLRFHIREAVEKGHASRIGHGVDVMYEDDAIGLLRDMAARKVAVEICLTSNDVILNVSGKEHPLQNYMKAGVPVLLATDDQGVSRSDMTLEFKRAVLDQNLDYATLKQMVYNSIKYSFVQEPTKQNLLTRLGQDFAAFEAKWGGKRDLQDIGKDR